MNRQERGQLVRAFQERQGGFARTSCPRSFRYGSWERGQRKVSCQCKRMSKPPLTLTLSPPDRERETAAQLGGTFKMRPGFTLILRFDTSP